MGIVKLVRRAERRGQENPEWDEGNWMRSRWRKSTLFWRSNLEMREKCRTSGYWGCDCVWEEWKTY